jgi:hypothetical protein
VTVRERAEPEEAAAAADESEAIPPEAAAPGRPRRSRRRQVGLALLIVVGVAVVLALASLLPVRAMRGRFEQGKALLTQGQAALTRGDAKDAQDAFARARERFAGADRGVGALLLRAEALVPMAGRTPRAILSLADIGEDLSQAGLDAAQGLARLPGGLSALGVSDGRIPIETLTSLSPSVHRARLALEVAAAKAARLPDSWLFGPVADARQLLEDKLDQALPLARAGDEMLTALPRLAGADGPRRYFVAAENSAELRGTGGLIGNFAILTIDDGRISLGEFRDTQSLPNVPADQAPPVSSDFSDLYGPFGGAGFWLNVNMTPDSPTAAKAIEALYQRVTGEHLDGTIFFDLQGLADLLRTTGSVRVDRLGTTLTPENVTSFVAEAGYIDPKIKNTFREGPRLVAEAVWKQFLAHASPEDTVHALADAAANGHLIVHAADPSVQDALHQAGVDGALAPPSGDLFGVVLTNAAATKADYYLHQDMTYDVSLLPGGAASATASVRLTNDVPAGQSPSYALGPHPGLAVDGRLLEPGENRLWTQVYCGGVCTLVWSEQDGEAFPMESHRELDQDVFAQFVQEKAQESRQLTLEESKLAAWQGDVGGGEYRLRVHAQPVINPATVTVVIEAPPGMNIVWSNVPMTIHGDRAEWHGSLTRSQDLAVRFRPPLLQRTWARVWDFVSKPANGL